jgi:hypothetical protein
METGNKAYKKPTTRKLSKVPISTITMRMCHGTHTQQILLGMNWNVYWIHKYDNDDPRFVTTHYHYHVVPLTTPLLRLLANFHIPTLVHLIPQQPSRLPSFSLKVSCWLSIVAPLTSDETFQIRGAIHLEQPSEQLYLHVCDNQVTLVFRLAGVRNHPLCFSGDSGSARIFNIHSFI